MVFGDRLLGIYTGDVVSRHPGAGVVFDVKCSQGLVEYLDSIGAKGLMWKTGHSLIKAKLKEQGALLAGEMSGHMFFAEGFYGYDDAVYSSLRLLGIVSRTGRSLSELAADIPVYHSTPEIRVKCPDEVKFKVVEELREQFRKEREVVDIDGARVLFDDGWGLVRASNTGPVLVLRFEARSAEGLPRIRDEFYSRLKAWPEVEIPSGD
jgi:phosphomannomutase/phosphoglucomutase